MVFKRKLAAILSADILRYTAMIQRDESLALQLLEEHNTIIHSIFHEIISFEWYKDNDHIFQP